MYKLRHNVSGSLHSDNSFIVPAILDLSFIRIYCPERIANTGYVFNFNLRYRAFFVHLFSLFKCYFHKIVIVTHIIIKKLFFLPGTRSWIRAPWN